MSDNAANRKLLAGLGMLVLYVLLVIVPPPEGLTVNAQKAIALMICAVLAWVFEVLPIAVSAILFTLLPVVAGIVPLPKAMADFATPTVFFVFAMFCISIAFQNSGLSRRIVLWTSLKSNGSPTRLLFLLMMVSALLSSFLADIPVCAMMLPVAMLLLESNGCTPGKSAYGKAVMIGLPMACLIGGVGTPAGSAMNMLTMGMLQDMAKVDISFFKWMAMGLPMVLILTPIAWWAVIRVYRPELKTLQGMDEVARQYAELGPLSGHERRFLFLLALNFILWCTCGMFRMPLPVAALLGSVLFAVPRLGYIDWKHDKDRVGWDILMLIGACNALGMIIFNTGGATWIVQNCLGGLAAMPPLGIVAVISLFTVLIHLLVPVNTALVAVMVPALVVLAQGMGVNPALFVVPMGFSVSAALLLPLDPVPLVTYPAGYYRMGDMAKPGAFISVAWVIVMVLIMFTLARPLGLM